MKLWNEKSSLVANFHIRASTFIRIVADISHFVNINISSLRHSFSVYRRSVIHPRDFFPLRVYTINFQREARPHAATAVGSPIIYSSTLMHLHTGEVDGTLANTRNFVGSGCAFAHPSAL